MEIATKRNFKAGFTLWEIIIVLAVIGFLTAVIIPNLPSFSQNTDLDNNIQEFISVLRSAQNQTISSTGSSQYGVYLNIEVSPNKYVLFKGSSYASRDALADQTYSLSNTAEFYDINLGGGSEIIFDKLTGATENSGSLSIRIKMATVINKTIYVLTSGAIDFSPPASGASLDDSRVKDSRHIEFNYSRIINTLAENLVLTFDADTIETIPISSNLVAGQLQWESTVNVAGSDQTVEIDTTRLNSPDTLFSVFRNRSQNNKSLKIEISGDSSGYLLQYSADGSITNFSSIYVSNFAWQ